MWKVARDSESAPHVEWECGRDQQLSASWNVHIHRSCLWNRGGEGQWDNLVWPVVDLGNGQQVLSWRLVGQPVRVSAKENQTVTLFIVLNQCVIRIPNLMLNRFLSLRQMSFSDLRAEELTRACTWFPLSEIPLENIRNLRGQQLSDIWRLSYYLFRVCPGQVALTDDIGNP